MYGRRGSILAHFGWTWDYLHWGIKWHLVEKMMVDAPAYKFDKSGKDGKGKDKPKPQTVGSLRDLMTKKITV